MRIVAIIEARMRSSRLPGKVLKPILGRPMLALMIERLQRSSRLDAISIATTADESCDEIATLANELHVGCYRGSEDDVLDRVLKTAKHAKADLIVELTGDCPLLDPVIVDCVIEAFLANKVDYCSNGLIETYPRGMDVQVFPVSVLERVADLTDQPEDREHVSLYIYEHPDMFQLLNVESKLPGGSGDIRLTVDTEEDFELVRHIFEELYSVKPAFGLQDILDLLSRRPDLRAINRHVRQKAVR